MKTFALLATLLSLLLTPEAFAQRTRPGNADEQIVREAQSIGSSACIELYQHNVRVEPAFLNTLEDTCQRIGKLFGRTYDKDRLGDKLRVYVTDATNVSHVWHGYQHQSDPRGILILSRGAYFGALRGENATYAHELTHLFTWRFYSHTLREGLADYIALEILPGGVVGPNVKGYDWAGKMPDEVVDLLGTTVAPPGWVNDDTRLRQAYYFGSYRFVKLLIERAGLSKFMQLYAEDDPEAAFPKLYGKSRKQLIEELGL